MMVLILAAGLCLFTACGEEPRQQASSAAPESVLTSRAETSLYSVPETTANPTTAVEQTSAIEQMSAVEQTSVIEETTAVEETEAQSNEESLPQPAEHRLIRLGFAGDFKTAEGELNTAFMDAQPRGILDCISPELVEELRGFDLFMLNNEFSYSDRGKPMSGKTYTFRAKPERVKILHQLGVDLVLLANNHVFDYGAEAFADTLDILTEQGIAYVGAGRNRAEAKGVCYYTFDDMTVSYLAATRAENYRLTPDAGEDSGGVFGIYGEAEINELIDVIAEAKANSDFCIVSLHWGAEYSNYPDDEQQPLAHRLLDAGADAVIGSHAHVLQGIEIYKGKPVIYNLGNFWFNERWLYSGVFELTLDCADKRLTGARFIPCTQREKYTDYPQDAETRSEVLGFMTGLSFGVEFDEWGNILYDF